MNFLLAAVVAAAGACWFLPGGAHAAATLLLCAYLPGWLLLAAFGRAVPRPLPAILMSVGITYTVGIATNTVALAAGTPVGSWWGWAGQLVVTVGLLAAAWTKLPRDLPPPPWRWPDAAGTLALAALPLAAAAAATRTNDTGDATGSLIVLAVVVGLLGFAVIRPQLKLIPILLYSTALSVLLLGSLRGDFLSGHDPSKEFYMADLTRRAGAWYPGLSTDAYNSTLSVTVLPNHLAHLFGADLSTVFRLLIPALYALTPVVVHAVFSQHRNPRFGMLAALLYIAQPVFTVWPSVPFRQMVAIVMFTTLVYAMFNVTWTRVARDLAVLGFGSLLLVSHYSTGYVSLLLLALGTGLAHLGQRWASAPRASARASWRVVVALLLVAAAWYGPVTGVAENLTTTSRRSFDTVVKNGFNPFNATGYAPGTNLASQLGFGETRRDPQAVFDDYQNLVLSRTAENHVNPITPFSQAAPVPLNPPDTAPADTTAWGRALNLINSALKAAMRLFLVAGLLVTGWRFVRRKLVDYSFSGYVIAAGLTLAAIVIVPEASIEYDVGRTSQQLMILLAGPIVLGGQALVRAVTFGKASRQLTAAAITATLLTLLVFSSGALYRLTGATAPQIAFSDTGERYDQMVVHSGELAAATWLAAHRDPSVQVQAGYFSSTRLNLAGLERPLLRDVFPWSIDRHTYLYRGRYELASGNAAFYYGGTYLTYPYPTEAVSTAKDTLYANTDAVIYR